MNTAIEAGKAEDIRHRLADVESIPLGPRPDKELLDQTFRRLIGWTEP